MTETQLETSILPRLPFTKVLHTTIGGLVEDMPCGLGTVPLVNVDPADENSELVTASVPFFILYPLWGDLTDGTWENPDADAEWYYQVTMSSAKVTQLEWMRDRVLGYFLARRGGAFVNPIDVPGISVMNRWLSDDPGGTPAPAGSILQSDLRLAFKVTPKR